MAENLASIKLDNNLNDAISYYHFFSAFGYSDRDTVFLRTFKDKGEKDSGRNESFQLKNLSFFLKTLHEENQKDRGIFFVVNGGGQTDKEVKIARAQYIDFDDFSFDEQVKRLNAFPLEPSIIIKTKKSLHAYWLLKDGEIKYFREVQQRLIQHFGSDSTIQNESRVMRLYGFEHRKTDTPVMVTLIKFNPELRYTQKQFHEVLPLPEPADRTSEKKSKKDLISVPVGQGHDYIVSKIGEIVGKLGSTVDDESILALIETDFFSKYQGEIKCSIEDFRKKYLCTIKKFRERNEAEHNDPGFYSYALKAWKAENPGKEFNPDDVSWNEVKEAGRRAKENDIRIEEGNHKKAIMAALVAAGLPESDYKESLDLTINLDGSFSQIVDMETSEILYTFPVPDAVQPIPGKTLITTPGAIETGNDESGSASKKKSKKGIMYRELVLDLKDSAKITQFGKALYRIVDGKYYKLLGDIFIDHELISVRGMEPEKQKAAQTMIRALQKEEYIDYDSYYIGFKNGIMNWRTEEFFPYGVQEVPIFRYFDVNYNPDADTSFVDGIIADWCQGDDTKKEMLYELAGCCFYSDMPIKKWWAIEGKADTGKTTYIKLLRSTIGQNNVGSTPIQKLKDSNAIAELIDKSVNIVDDGSSKFTTDLSHLRRIIQGDDIQVKLLYQNLFSIRLESRMVFVFNKIPRFRDDNDATAKKMLVIGFNRVYSDSEKDTKLIEKLTTEENKEAFLCLAIDRMKKVIKRNLTFTVSEESKRITSQIIQESDQFVSFAAETISDDYDWKHFLDGKRTSDVYEDFRRWAIDEGYKNILTRSNFTTRCCKESGATIRRSHGNSFYAFHC